MSESVEENAYEILGLPQGPDANDTEIKKASTYQLCIY